MATVKFVRYSSQSITVLKNVEAYVKQDEKTLLDDGQRLISGINCTPQMAFREFVATRETHHKESPVWFYHYTQAFHPDENIKPQQAHELAKEFAAKAWPDSEVLVTTHIDKPHIHSHFLVNAVCHQTGRMLRQEKGTLQRLRDLSDELCEAHSFSVLKEAQKKSDGMSAREYRSAAKGQSWKMQIICAVDYCMKRSGSKEEFIRNIKKMGYQVRWEDARRNITYTHPNGMKARDIKLFDKKYLKEVMEREFRIRAEIIFGGAEAAPSADTSTTGADASSRSASHEGGVDGDDGVSRYTVVSHGSSDESAEESQRTVDAAPDQDAGGRAAEIGEASGVDGRTGWEAEREAFFSAQHQTAQTATPAPGRPDMDSPADGGGSVASAVVGLGYRLEQSQSAEPVSDSTTMRHYTDSKTLRKEQRKKIAQGHAVDDHEGEQTWQQTM